MSSEMEILIIFGGFLMCWLAPGCGPSQRPLGQALPRGVRGERLQSVLLGIMAGFGEILPPRERAVLPTCLSPMVQPVFLRVPVTPLPKRPPVSCTF